MAQCRGQVLWVTTKIGNNIYYTYSEPERSAYYLKDSMGVQIKKSASPAELMDTILKTEEKRKGYEYDKRGV